MASLAQFHSVTPGPGRVPASGIAADGLAAFRLRADTAYDRSLSTLIESEIIPRLMLAHSADAPNDQPQAMAVVDAAEIAILAELAMQVEAGALLRHVEAALGRGLCVDTVMIELLSPAARLLGEYWESDRCDFVEVTMGLWRLQEVVHEIAARIPADRLLAAGGHRALFASMPGDQHSFGTVVIDELFRRGGWATDRISDAETPDLLRRVGDEWFDLIGLTVSCDCHVETLPAIIVAMRNVSRNPHVCIMVGGRIFSAAPELALAVGADGTARDAKLALQVALDLVRARAGEVMALR